MSELSFDTIVENLKEGKPFSWSRWGDGEWSCILQTRKGGKNCDGHTYFPELGEALKDILESKPEYYLGLQRLATEQNEANPEFKRLQNLNTWCDNELLHRASIKGRFNEFLEALEGKKVIIVGNESLRKLPIKYVHFVDIPLKDCWMSYHKTLIELRSNTYLDSVILYAASMMTNVLIDDLYDIDLTQIDCGSVFDPYVNRHTRTYHKNLKIA